MASVLRAASPGGVHVALLREAAAFAGVVDGPAVFRDLLAGFPLVGPLPADPTAEPELRPAPLTPEEVLARAPSRAPRLVSKALRSLRRLDQAGLDHLATVFAKTQEDVALGRLGPLSEVSLSPDGTSLPLSRRFAVLQLSSSGKLKVREIDDLHESEVNEAASVTRRIRMGRLDSLIATARAFRLSQPGTPLQIVKSDFRSAYRCVPISAQHLRWARVLVLDPSSGKAYVATQWAMPFGALGAVYAWDRLAAVVTAVLRRTFLLPVIRYVDDLFLVLPASLAPRGREVLLEVVSLFGLVLDPIKTPPASSDAVVLGVRALCLSRAIVFQVEPSKLAFWRDLLSDLLQAGSSTDLDLSKVTGRLSFGCWAVWGPGARSRLAPFFRPARLSRGRLSPALLQAVRWWVSFLASSPSLSARHLVDPPPSAPFILYTDAEGSGGVGACLFHPNGSPGLWFGGVVSSGLRRRVSTRWGYHRGCPIFLLEAVVPIVCFRAFGPFLRGQRLLLFIDNSTALFALRKGRSKLSLPLNELCFNFWRIARQLELEVVVAWVPTRFNVADDPSRGVPPVGCGPSPFPVSDSVWERAFRPALRL